MQSIQSVQGKLLYLARQMLIENQISKKQQGVFKGTQMLNQDLIFGEIQSLFDIYNDYLNKGTQLTLRTSLIKQIRKQSKLKSKCSEQNDTWQSGSGASKKSSKRQRSMKIIIPPKNIQKLPAQMNRI